VISPLLANIALHGMESLIKAKFPENKRKRFWTPLVVRYADGTPVQASNLWGGSPLTLIVRSGV